MSQIPGWRRVIRAAGRLAAIYVVTALLLLIAAVALMAGILPTFSDLLELWIPVSIAFLSAFLLLAVARRAGFVGFWLLLLGLWVYMWQDLSNPHVGVAKAFIAWTILALPLYGLGMIGAPSSGPLARKSSLAVAIVWFCLILAAFAVAAFGTSNEILHMLARNGGVIWVPFPFVLCLYELQRVWKATGQMSTAQA